MATKAVPAGGATQQQHVTEPQREGNEEEVLVLPLAQRKHVSWDEEVVDNEHLNKKSSKRCCIFHKKKHFGESDSDESDEDVEAAERAPPKAGVPHPSQRYHA